MTLTETEEEPVLVRIVDSKTTNSASKQQPERLRCESLLDHGLYTHLLKGAHSSSLRRSAASAYEIPVGLLPPREERTSTRKP
ncbi:hypothetical protein TSAR_001630 [Trichomalopsis sarcophagae]|uniref:Uncharacterized protein n=1 Tax=Trichomalopsis sarcophagae TaxID=543379 RepID=A0A232F8J3_9HYME|nr:hypothetical protein TSAR_001630 [Trichomalopsis sarcophagae]